MLTLLLDLGFDPHERRRLDGLDEVVYSWGEPLRTSVENLPLAEILLKRGADSNPSIYAGTDPSPSIYRGTSPMFEAYAPCANNG
jgi:hypothetical protein